MRKVETQTVTGHQRTCLLYMIAQNHTQGFLQQMGGTVVLAGVDPVLLIHGQGYLVAHLEHTALHGSHMADLAAQQMDHIFYLKLCVRQGNRSDVRLLSAHGGIERGLVHENRCVLALGDGLYHSLLGGEHRDGRLVNQVVITHKDRSHGRVDLLVYGSVCAHIVCRLPGAAGFLSLHIHGSLEAFLIHQEALLLQDLFCQIQRESIRII